MLLLWRFIRGRLSSFCVSSPRLKLVQRCIFAEMATGRPLFTGTSESDQLARIFRQLGTPSLAMYPGLQDLPDYRVRNPASACFHVDASNVMHRMEYSYFVCATTALIASSTVLLGSCCSGQADVIQYSVPECLDHLVPGLDAVGVDLLAVSNSVFVSRRRGEGSVPSELSVSRYVRDRARIFSRQSSLH